MFNEYPYRNLTDVNLDYILKHIRELEINLQDFIKLNTIKYADPIDWDISKQYESNTVVVNEFIGVAYLSTKPVPSGVDVTNTEYWTPIFTLDFVNMNKNITLRNDGNNNNATFTSAVGDWLIVGGQLYKVIQDIGLHTQYVVGYNIQVYSVELFVRDYLNQVLNLIGDLDDLNTSDKTSIVNAINSIVNAINDLVVKIGNIQELDTEDKTSIVNAINEIVVTTSNIAYYTPEMFGAVGDGVTDDTTAVQNAMNAGGVILSKSYKISTWLFTHHNVLGLNSSLIIDSDGENEGGTLLINGDNIIVDGINFNGNYTGAGTKDGTLEYSHGIRVGECKNFKISNCTISNFRGDGIYIYGDSENGLIENVTINSAYRNSISFIDCWNVKISNCIFNKTGDYVSCVDLEPNQGYGDKVHDIIFDNCQFNSHGIQALNIYPDVSVNDPSVYNIYFRNCNLKCEMNNPAILCNGSGRVYNIGFTDCNITANVGTPIRLNVADQGNITLERCTITGTNSGLSSYGIFGAHKIIIRDCKYTGVGSISLNTPTGTLEMIDNVIEINNYTGNDGYSYNGAINSNCKEYRLKDNFIYGHKGSIKLSANNTTVMVIINNVFKSRSDLTNKIGFEVTIDGDKTLDALIFENNSSINNNIPFAFPSNHTLQPATYTFNQALKKIMYTDSMPSSTAPFSSMTFNIGDIAYNKTPTSGGNIGWVCTLQGTPGTWKPFGTIS